MQDHIFQADDINGILANIASHGFAIIPELLDCAGRQDVRDALAAHRTGLRGRNDFEGYQTERIYSLLARGRVFADLTENPTILAVLDRMLEPNYLLSAGLSIDLHPGETPQALHFDDSFYNVPRPRPAIGISVIWAIDPFTDRNGATQLIAGSHAWGETTPGGVPDDREIALPRSGPAYLAPVIEDLESLLLDAVIPAGSALIFPGTLWHRGGGNRSSARRLAVTLQYCAPWARQQENMFLAVPDDITRSLSQRVRALMGYSIHPPFMGHVDSVHPEKYLKRPETSEQ